MAPHVYANVFWGGGCKAVNLPTEVQVYRQKRFHRIIWCALMLERAFSTLFWLHHGNASSYLLKKIVKSEFSDGITEDWGV